MKLRQSAFQDYLECPRKFYKRYICGIEEPPSLPKELGTAVHSIIEKWFDKKEIDVEKEAARMAKKIWYLSPSIDRYDIDQAVNEIAEQISIMIKIFLKNFRPDQFSTKYVERPMEVEIASTGDVVTGKPDYVEIPGSSIGRIVDFKTGWKPQDTIQPLVYAWLCSIHYGLNDFIFELWYLRNGEVKQQQIDLFDIEKTRNWITQVLKEINLKKDREDEFPATPNQFCDYCSYIFDCPAAEKGTEEEITSQNAEELGEECLVLEARVKNLKNMLKEYVKKNGAVNTSGGVFDFHETNPGKKVTNIDEFYWRLKMLGLDPGTYLGPYSKELKKALERLRRRVKRPGRRDHAGHTVRVEAS